MLTLASRRHLTSLPPVWMSTSVDLDRAESMQANKDMFNGVVGGPAGKRCRGRPLCDYLAMFVILFASGLGLDPWRYPLLAGNLLFVASCLNLSRVQIWWPPFGNKKKTSGFHFISCIPQACCAL